MKTASLVYGLTLIFLFNSALPVFAESSWKQTMSRKGITVYTNDLPESNIDEFKGVTTIDAPIEVIGMVLLDVEHPPAAGTALGVAITQLSPSVVLTVLISSIALSLAHRFLRRFLRDLV